MTNETSNKPALYFWIAGIIAFIWYAFGIYAYVMQAFFSQDQLRDLANESEIIYDNLPLWYLSAFAIAVFTGFIGSICLLARKRAAYILFIISFLAVGIQQFYILTEINPRDIFLSLSSLVIAVFLIWFSKRAITRKWLV